MNKKYSEETTIFYKPGIITMEIAEALLDREGIQFREIPIQDCFARNATVNTYLSKSRAYHIIVENLKLIGYPDDKRRLTGTLVTQYRIISTKTNPKDKKRTLATILGLTNLSKINFDNPELYPINHLIEI